MSEIDPAHAQSGAGAPPAIAGVAPALRHLAAGDWLFHCGDKSFGMFFAASGRLRMQRVTPDGGAVAMHTARAGETFAEASLFVERYQCGVVADTESNVWCYPKEELIGRLRDSPETLWAFAARLARDLHGLRQRYELKQIRSASERVLQFIRLRCDATGRHSGTGPLKDMAAELGLTHEALYRALSSLEKRGLIDRQDGLRLRLPKAPRTR